MAFLPVTSLPEDPILPESFSSLSELLFRLGSARAKFRPVLEI
jgi:hypothetical protein